VKTAPIDEGTFHPCVQSLIDLQRQAENLIKMKADGVKSWAGASVSFQLETTAKAMLADVRTLQDARGACSWSESKRQFALRHLANAKS